MKPPGFLATLFALIGLIAFLLADFAALLLMDVLLTEPETVNEGLGQAFVGVISLIYGIGLSLAGSLTVLIGKIWKQRKPLVLLSTLAYSFYLAVFGWFTISVQSTDTSVLYLWGFYILILALHFRGLIRFSDEIQESDSW